MLHSNLRLNFAVTRISFGGMQRHIQRGSRDGWQTSARGESGHLLPGGKIDADASKVRPADQLCGVDKGAWQIEVHLVSQAKPLIDDAEICCGYAAAFSGEDTKHGQSLATCHLGIA